MALQDRQPITACLRLLSTHLQDAGADLGQLSVVQDPEAKGISCLATSPYRIAQGKHKCAMSAIAIERADVMATMEGIVADVTARNGALVSVYWLARYDETTCDSEVWMQRREQFGKATARRLQQQGGRCAASSQMPCHRKCCTRRQVSLCSLRCLGLCSTSSFPCLAGCSPWTPPSTAATGMHCSRWSCSARRSQLVLPGSNAWR